jgi:hypothetical protein
MRFRPAALSCVAAAAVLVSACGGADERSASDKASGLSVSVAGDQVTLKRTAKSGSGTGGKAGQVSCTDDYAKLAKASELPAPSTDWYAATLITWPDKGKETTATLSHELDGDPDLCIAQASDQSAQVVVYFDGKVKQGVEKLQSDQTRAQQAEQATQTLQAAAQLAVAVVADKKFPTASTIVTALSGQGLVVKTAAARSAIAETGTVYVLTGESGASQVVLAVKGKDGKLSIATQKPSGSPKITTAK